MAKASDSKSATRYKVVPSGGSLNDSALGVFEGALALRDACKLAIGTRGRVVRQKRTSDSWHNTEIAYAEIERMRSLSGDVVEVFALRVVVPREDMSANERRRFSRPIYR